MSLVGGGLVGGAVGFQLFNQANGQAGIYANAAARDVYFDANQNEVNRVATDEFLIIKLLDGGSGQIAYQQYTGAVGVAHDNTKWLDVTSLVQGETGPPGATGNSFFFKNIAQRDIFFNTVGNEQLLVTDLPVVVNQGNAVTTFIWTGIDQPVSYDADLFIEHAINTGPGTLFLGIDGAALSSAAKTINFDSAFGDKALPLGESFTDDGSVGPTHFEWTKLTDLLAADVFSSQLTSPNEWVFTGALANTYTNGITIRPATAGTIRLKAFAGINNTFPIVIDTTYEVLVGDIGNTLFLDFPNGLLAVAGDAQMIELSGVDIFGGLQTSGLFNGQIVGFLRSDTHFLEVVDLMTRKELDDYVMLNSEYKTASVKTGGINVVTLPTATTDTVSAAEFFPGVAATSNPTVTTIGSGTFSQNDLVSFVSDPGQPNANDAVYEVHDHIGTTLQMRGVGLNATVEDFTEDQFVNIIAVGTLTKVGVSVLKLTDTSLEQAFGNTTPLSFSAIGASLDLGSFDANDAIFPASNPAVADSRNGHPILAFDDTVAENVLFSSIMPADYSAGNILIDIDWVAATATTGGVTWGVEIERNAPAGNDIDSDSFDTQQTGTSTTNPTSGIITRTTITLTQAEADAIAANDSYRMRIQRVVGDVGDDMSGDAQITGIGWRQ